MNYEEQSALFAPEKDPLEQFRLRCMQLYNWGTFSDVLSIDIAAEGFLFVGPSGSGKSTILDANAALLTPPRWVDFNVAAREGERAGRDRSLVSYVRGAWGEQTEHSGEVAAQYLRTGTTWSAIVQQYADGRGHVVTLARLLWIRGNSRAVSDVQSLYLVLERAFDIRELNFFGECDFDVRRFKAQLSDAFICAEPSRFQERFRRLLGIESVRALRLLHKTQSAKNMGDLNAFLRDYMLDEPQTFELARSLVEQFGELNDAYRAVKDARLQVETLEPAQAAYDELQAVQARRTELEELEVNLERYCEQKKKALLEDALALREVERNAQEQTVRTAQARVGTEQEKLDTLNEQRIGMGGGLIARLEQELTAASRQREAREGKRALMHEACRTMGWSTPDTPLGFANQADSAGKLLARAQDDARERQQRWAKLHDARKAADEDFTRLHTEIQAMERQTSNVPARLLAMREALALRLRVDPSELPFVAELLEVKAAESAWQGAIERVLHGFARSLLVPQDLYEPVTRHVNEMNLGGRLVYLRMLPQSVAGGAIPANAVYRKLEFARTPAANWVREELKARFEYLCTDTLEEFRRAPKAVTLAGQIKHGPSRHEKDDRAGVNDRREWVLGFDNQAKLELYKAQALESVERGQTALAGMQALEDESTAEDGKRLACNTLKNLAWEEVDLASSLRQVDELKARIAAAHEASPKLAEQDALIEAQRKRLEAAQKEQAHHAGELETLARQLSDYNEKLQALRAELLEVALTPFAREQLDVRFAPFDGLALGTLDAAALKVAQALAGEARGLIARAGELSNQVRGQFDAFIRQWRGQSDGLDATLASAPDFFAKLERLKTDGLPQYEARFLQLLNEQNDQNLTRLASQLEHERKAIRERMEVVNNGLATTAYNPGTHLTIQTQNLQIAEVVAFKQGLREALSNALSADAQQAEARFQVIHALVQRFSSQESADVRWRELVLDVRRHVDFIARELYDADGTEAEVLRSGSGKSGGQRQKLAATCLAAALSYQLGGREQALPRFCSVFMDEAFDKSDSEFTQVAMDVFRTFGFQMLVATPLKSVMTLEPYIGGACFVHNQDRKTSRIIEIAYDRQAGRLKFSAEQQHDVQEAATA